MFTTYDIFINFKDHSLATCSAHTVTALPHIMQVLIQCHNNDAGAINISRPGHMLPAPSD